MFLSTTNQLLHTGANSRWTYFSNGLRRPKQQILYLRHDLDFLQMSLTCQCDVHILFDCPHRVLRQFLHYASTTTGQWLDSSCDATEPQISFFFIPQMMPTLPTMQLNRSLHPLPTVTIHPRFSSSLMALLLHPSLPFSPSSSHFSLLCCSFVFFTTISPC